MADFATTTSSPDALDPISQAIADRLGGLLESRLFPAILSEVEKKSKAALQAKESFSDKFKKFEKDLDNKGLFGIGWDWAKQKLSKKDEKTNPLKQATDALKVQPVTDTKEKLPGPVKDNKDFQQAVTASNADIIQEAEEKPKTVILGGLTADFEKRLPEILKDIFPKEKEEEKEEKKDDYSDKGLLGKLGIGGVLAGGLALVLGGITALVMAFKTDGGAKGMLETIGKLGLKGGLVILAKKIFGMTLKGALKKIPIIGTLISYGFAIQRFTKGDTIGGIIDLVSGTVQLLDLVAPGLGTVLSLGVDILQSVLDAKAGGSSAEASAKKGGILLDWAKGLGSMIYKGVKYLPVVGPLVQMAEDLSKGKWVDALYSMVRATPGLGTVLDIIDYFTGGKTQETIKGGLGKAVDWAAGMGKWLADKVIDLPIIGPLIKSTQALFAGQWKDSLIWLGRAVPFVGMIMDWLDVKTSDEQKDVKQEAPKKSPFTVISMAIMEKARKWWKSTWSWVKWLARKVLPKNVIESLEGQVKEKLEGVETPEGEVKVEAGPLDNLKKLGGVVADKVKDFAKGAANWVKSQAEGLKNKFKEGLNWAKEKASKLAEIGKSVLGYADKVKDWAVDNAKAISEKVNNFAKNTVNNAIEGAKKMREKISSVFASSKEWLGEQKDKLADVYKSVSDTAGDIRKWVHENITLKIANFLKDTVKKIFGWIKDTLGSVVSKIGSFITPSVADSNKEVQQHGERLTAIEAKLASMVSGQPDNRQVYKPQDLSSEEMSKRAASTKNALNVTPETNQIRSAENYQQKDEKPINIEAGNAPIIDEKFLKDISSNTEKTHYSLENLIRLMYKFTQVLDKKMIPDGQQKPNIILGQQQEYESASRASASNFDPIRHVRSQFALETP